MRLAVVIERYDSQHGGAERSTAQIVRRLVERGHEVTVVAGHCPEREPAEGFRIERYLSRKSLRGDRLVRFSRWARQVVGEGDFDASLSMTMVVPGTVLQPRGGTVRETIDRNIQIRRGVLGRAVKRVLVGVSPKQRLLLSLERKTLSDPGVRRIAAVSGYVADQLDKHYGVGSDRVVVIPNASEMPVVNDRQRGQWRAMVREGFGVPGDGLVFLFAALNPRLKGVDTLLQAVRLLADRGVQMTLLLAGQIGYAQQHRAATLGIRDQVRIVGPTRRMAQLYAASDVTVHPTYYDPASKVVIESLMMGVPAISTTFNGASDLIVGRQGEAVCGRVIQDPGDAVALADAMVEMTDQATRASCAAATVGLAEQLSMDRHVDRLESTLRELHSPQALTPEEPEITTVGAGA